MNRENLTAFLAVFMRAADFVVRAVDEAHDWAVEWLPFCAANDLLHVIKEGGDVSGVAIAGPISSATLLACRRPASILPPDFEPAGDVLFGAYLFVDPARRGHGAGLERFGALMAEARLKFPQCARFAYCRRGRLVVRPFPPQAAQLQESAISTSGETTWSIGDQITSAELEEQMDYGIR